LSDPISLTIVYNPNLGNAPNFLSDLYSHLSSISDCFTNKAIIVGDFNIDILKNNELVIDYMTWYTSHNFVIATQNHPTRISKSTSTLIDHISCSRFLSSWKLANIMDDLSDHNLLLLLIPTMCIPKNCDQPRSMFRTDYKALRSYLAVNHFSVKSDNVNLEFQQFHNYLLHALESSITKVNSKKNKYSTC